MRVFTHSKRLIQVGDRALKQALQGVSEPSIALLHARRNKCMTSNHGLTFCGSSGKPNTKHVHVMEVILVFVENGSRRLTND